MSIENLPHVPPKLVEALNEHFPLQEVTESDSFEAIRWKAAQRSVVKFLERAVELQTDNIAMET